MITIANDSTTKVFIKYKICFYRLPPTLPAGSRRQGGSTREFGQHALREGVLTTFTSWLQTVDGKEHSPDQANQIGVDVSKYLYFCDQEVVRTQFAWDHVSFNKYIAALQKAEISTTGILVKILRLRNFLDYILSTLQPTAEEEKQIQKMVDKLKKYHCHFA